MKSDQVQMLKCNADGSKVRFFGNYLNSFVEQDASLLSKLEKHSAIYIESPKWPIYFAENNFIGNVGLFGGAISINTPTFKNATSFKLKNLQDFAVRIGKTADSVKEMNFNELTNMEKWNDVEVQPVVVIYNNRFENN